MANNAGPGRSWAGGALAVIVLTLLYFVYRAFPDALRNYDGLMFSSVVSQESGMWRSEMWSYSSHFLFNPVGWLFHRGAVTLGLHQRGFITLFQMNALLSCGTVAVLGHVFSEAIGDRWSALPLALGAAHSANFWSRASECSVYALHLFAAALVFWALWRDARRPSVSTLAALGAAVAFAVLTHISAVFWVPGVFLAVGIQNGRWRHAVVLGAASAAAVFLVFAATYRIVDLESLAAWYRNQGSVGPLAAGTPDGLPGWRWAPDAPFLFRGLVGVLWAVPAGGGLLPWAAGAVGLAGLSALGWMVVRSPRPRVSGVQRPLLLGGGGMILGVLFLQSVHWGREDTKFSSLVFPVFLGLALGAAAVARVPARRNALRGALLAFWAGTFGCNLTAAIVPGSRLENNTELMKALFVRDHTPANAVVVINGGMLRLYLPGNAARQAVDLAYPLALTSKAGARAFVEDQIRTAVLAGRPLFAVNEVVDASAWAETSDRGWDRTDRDRWLAPFDVQETARRNDWALYALRPRTEVRR